jgi:hypothetical protein
MRTELALAREMVARAAISVADAARLAEIMRILRSLLPEGATESPVRTFPLAGTAQFCDGAVAHTRADLHAKSKSWTQILREGFGELCIVEVAGRSVSMAVSRSTSVSPLCSGDGGAAVPSQCATAATGTSTIASTVHSTMHSTMLTYDAGQIRTLVNIPTSDEAQVTPLYVASQNNHAHVVRM